VLEKMGIINATNQLYDTLNAANNGSSGQLDPNPYVAAGTTAHPLGGVVLGRVRARVHSRCHASFNFCS
jgi:hypothetical protein